MRVLVACEFSGKVREAFRRRGHEAWSCDLLPAADKSPYHMQRDVRSVLTDDAGMPVWDLIIAHPPCTYLCSSGLHHNGKDAGRRQKTEMAIDFVQLLLDAPAPHIALENPIGCISTRIRPPEQIIQPWAFGEDASKATCLWLKGLPPLVPTKYIAPTLGRGGRPIWGNQTESGQNKLPPSADRAMLRSITYEGIAEAMADQWGKL